MATDSTEGGLPTESKVSCGSKRSLDVANKLVFSAVNEVIGKNTVWSEDQQERLRRRFHEVYENAVHENIEFDGQTWAEVEAHEDGDSTQEFEAVDLERQNQVQDMAGDLDTLLVETVAKRKQYPRKITQQVAKKLQCQHVALENHKSVLVSSKEECSSQSVVNTDDVQSVSDRLTTTGKNISTLTKTLPMLQDKATRIYDAVDMQNSTSKTSTHHIITNPHPEENKMATSLTSLQKRLNETPSSMDEKISKRHLPKKELRDHPIKRYKLRNVTPS